MSVCSFSAQESGSFGVPRNPCFRTRPTRPRPRHAKVLCHTGNTSLTVFCRNQIVYNLQFIAEKSIFVASPSIWKKRINCIFCSFEIKKKKLVVLRWMWVRSSREAFLILMFQFIELTKCSSCLLVNRVCQKPRCKKQPQILRKHS